MSVDTIADKTGAQGTEPDPYLSDLLGCISQYEREYDKWKKRVKKIIERYRDENRNANDGSQRVKFNILWSNVQTLVPATFAKLPQPDVSRRFRDSDPVGRVAALLLERALDYEIQHYPDYAASLRQCVFDRFLGGRGTAWVRYEPHFRAAQANLPTDGVEVSEDIDEPQEELDYECSPVDYVSWEDFGHSPARTWEEVTKVWRCVYMYEDAVKARFGEEWARKIPYDSSPREKDGSTYKGGDRTPKQAKIYEVWNKETKTACWISKSLNEVIDERDDPLGLAGFWPCPQPLYATLTNDTLVPVPDFTLYQDQARELDVLSDRIDGLINALQVKGVHDAAVPELARLFTEAGNTDLIPIKNFAAFAEKNGLAGAIDLVDLEPFAKALKEAYLAMSQVKEYIYEITGISDIVRGQSNAEETLGAQKIKENFVGLRLSDMKHGVASFAAQLICIKGQIICAKYSVDTILKISCAEQLEESDLQYVPAAVELLIGMDRMRDPEAKPGPNPTRQFRIDIQSDSLVNMNESQEKQDRMEFLKATSEFMKGAMPAVEQAPEMAPLLMQMLMFGVRGFKVGRTIEGDFEQAVSQLKQIAAQPRQPKPDPEMERVKAESDIQQKRIAADRETNQQKMELAEKEAILKAQLDKYINELKISSDEKLAQSKLQVERELKILREQMEDLRLERELSNAEKIETGKRQLERETEQTKAEVDEKVRMEDVRIRGMKSIEEFEAKEDSKGTPSVREIQSKAAAEQSQALTEAVTGLSKAMEQFALAQQQIAKAIAAPKRLVRGPDGRAIGTEIGSLQ